MEKVVKVEPVVREQVVRIPIVVLVVETMLWAARKVPPRLDQKLDWVKMEKMVVVVGLVEKVKVAVMVPQKVVQMVVMVKMEMVVLVAKVAKEVKVVKVEQVLALMAKGRQQMGQWEEKGHQKLVVVKEAKVLVVQAVAAMLERLAPKVGVAVVRVEKVV